jgi:hypothetical protein
MERMANTRMQVRRRVSLKVLGEDPAAILAVFRDLGERYGSENVKVTSGVRASDEKFRREGAMNFPFFCFGILCFDLDDTGRAVPKSEVCPPVEGTS